MIQFLTGWLSQNRFPAAALICVLVLITFDAFLRLDWSSDVVFRPTNLPSVPSGIAYHLPSDSVFDISTATTLARSDISAKNRSEELSAESEPAIMDPLSSNRVRLLGIFRRVDGNISFAAIQVLGDDESGTTIFGKEGESGLPQGLALRNVSKDTVEIQSGNVDKMFKIFEPRASLSE